MRLAQHPLRRLPVDARIGDRDAELQVGRIGGQPLVALAQVALDHQADQGAVAGDDLAQHVGRDDLLAARIATAVGVAAIDHDHRIEAGLGQLLLGAGDADRVVVGAIVAAAQDDVHIGVAARVDDAREAVLVDAQEAVAHAGRAHRVDGDLQAAVGAVLEADGEGDAAGQLAVDLRFGRARADGAPADQVGQVVGRDRIEHLAGGRQAQLDDLGQQAAGALQALVHVAGAVQARVVDHALPAHRRAWLLEVDAHDRQQTVGELVGQGAQAARVLQGRLGVVDRAGTDDDEQPVGLAAQDADDLVARGGDGRGRGLGLRDQRLQFGGRRQGREALDAEVFGAAGHGICTISLVISAVLRSIADTEQKFSSDSITARSTFSAGMSPFTV